MLPCPSSRSQAKALSHAAASASRLEEKAVGGGAAHLKLFIQELDLQAIVINVTILLSGLYICYEVAARARVLWQRSARSSIARG